MATRKTTTWHDVIERVALATITAAASVVTTLAASHGRISPAPAPNDPCLQAQTPPLPPTVEPKPNAISQKWDNTTWHSDRTKLSRNGTEEQFRSLDIHGRKTSASEPSAQFHYFQKRNGIVVCHRTYTLRFSPTLDDGEIRVTASLITQEKLSQDLCPSDLPNDAETTMSTSSFQRLEAARDVAPQVAKLFGANNYLAVTAD